MTIDNSNKEQIMRVLTNYLTRENYDYVTSNFYFSNKLREKGKDERANRLASIIYANAIKKKKPHTRISRLEYVSVGKFIDRNILR